MPIAKAKITIIISKTLFSIILVPNIGRLVKINGNKAQWIAHASEAAMPKVSQFILKFLFKGGKGKGLQQSCK